MAAYQRRDYTSAITLFDTVLAGTPDHPEAALRRNDAMLKLRLSEAYARGRAAENVKDWSSAADAYQVVLELDPHYEDAAARRDACRIRSAGDGGHQGTPTAGDAERRAEPRAYPDSDADLPEVSQTGSGPEEPIDQNALERLWQRAQDVTWTSRPDKEYLQAVAAVLSPQERVVGVCRLYFSIFKACCFVVTSLNLYLSAEAEDKYWKGLRESTPSRFRTNEEVLSVPVTAVEACAITANGMFVIRVNGEPAITFKGYFSGSDKTRVEEFFNAARSNA